MRRAARVDSNQKLVVEALRKAGCTVQLLHAVGGGCPDLLAFYQGQVFMVEVKDGSRPPSEQKLTPDQITWHREWQAQVHIVNSVDQALAVVEQYKRKAA